MEELGLRGINCGSGRRLFPGWINTDRMHLKAWDKTETEPGRIMLVEGECYYLELDSRESYPFEDETFEWVYSEHFVEHLDLEEAIAWLAQIRRLLKPGGHVRLSTPDLRLFAEAYFDPEQRFFTEYAEHLAGMRAFRGREQEVPARPAGMLNQIFYFWQHNWIFDFDELRFAAERAGFDPAGVTRWRFRDSAVPELEELDIPERAAESLYVELTRGTDRSELTRERDTRPG
jgi:predicted SAM-dependent methyltransferase